MPATDHRQQLVDAIHAFSHFWLDNPLEGDGQLDDTHRAYRAAYDLAHAEDARAVTSADVEAFDRLTTAANHTVSACARRVDEWRQQAARDDPAGEHPTPDLTDQLAELDDVAARVAMTLTA